MKKNFFRRRSISYRGRGNFATQLSFSQPIVKLAVWLYFIICILVIGTRVFFMTQADHYRDEITALVSEAAGVDVHAGEFSAGFERFWPVITVRQLELARPGGPVSLTLPEVKARLAWSSLWHLEPRFQLLRISSPDLRITLSRQNDARHRGLRRQSPRRKRRGIQLRRFRRQQGRRLVTRAEEARARQRHHHL